MAIPFPSDRVQEAADQVVLKTLLMCDLVDSTRLIGSLGDRRTAGLFARHDRLARELLARHGGQEIDKTDGFLLLFERPLHAVRYALEYHQTLADLAAEEDVELSARAAIHLGEVVVRRNPPEDVARGAKPVEVEGLAKPTAARLMSVAAARQTLLTRVAFDVARRAEAGTDSLGADLRWLAHGSYLFQGVEEPVEIFEVGVDGFAPLAAPGESAKVHRQDHEGILGWRPAAGQAIEARPNWELERKLGAGGFGEVWLARHVKTHDRRVFKFCFDAQRLRGLQREITVFRLLKEELGERRDIARILDWNFERVPYFIESEYTAGGSLIDWAESEGGLDRVPLATRLEIVAQVAEALAAAHSVGVLHKDVKPGNVLIHVGDDGRVEARLADFGIGLVTDPSRLEAVGITVMSASRLSGATELEATGGTRLYHAPELVEGKAATVQADVYALGVMLYQMALGDLFRALGPGWERQVDDELLREDIAVAVDVSPRRRLGNAIRIAERLRGLGERRAEREVERRAQADAERWRTRRRWIAPVIGVLLVFAGAMAHQARRVAREAERANLERATAERVAQFMVDLFEISNPWEARSNAITAREILDQGARKIRLDLPDQPLTRARLMAAIGTVYQKMGLHDPAEPLLEEALEIRRRQLPGDSLDLAESLDRLATLYGSQSRYAEAEPLYVRALAIREKALGADHLQVASSLANLGHLYTDHGRYSEAEPLYARALEIRQSEPEPDRLELAALLRDVATHRRLQSRYGEAERLYQRSLELVEEELDGDHPRVSQLLNDLGLVFWDQGRYAEAEPLFLRALDVGEKALGADHPNLAANLNNLGNLYRDQGRHGEAAPMYERALAIWEAAGHPKVAYGLNNLARLYCSVGRFDDAEPLFERSLEIAEEVLGPDHMLTAHPLHGLATVYREQGRFGEAEGLYRRALQTRQRVLSPDHRDLQKTREDFATLLRQTGRGEEAAALEARN